MEEINYLWSEVEVIYGVFFLFLKNIPDAKLCHSINSPSSCETCLHSSPSPLLGVAGPSSCGYKTSALVPEQEIMKGKDLRSFTLEECCNLLTSLGLGHLKHVFETNQMDGPLLFALTHPQLGAVMLDSMGLSSSDQYLLVSGIKEYVKM